MSDPVSRARALFGWIGGRLIDTASESSCVENHGARFVIATWTHGTYRPGCIARGATAEECIGNGIYRGNADPRARLTERERAYLERPVPAVHLRSR